MQFGEEPLFDNILAKFDKGNRYRLIDVDGCGKSTLMKIVSDELEPSSYNVSVVPRKRMGTLSQDQFAFELVSVIDTVIMDDKELWIAT